MSKKYFIRAIAALLVLLMCLPLAISCGDKQKNPSAESSGNNNNTTDNNRDDLPELDYNGEDVNLLTHGYDIYHNETTIDEPNTADIVDMAVWNREMVVEDRLNINLVNNRVGTEWNQWDVVPDEIRTEILAGTNNYDIGVSNMAHTIQYAGEGLFYDLNKVPNVDTTKSYYSQGVKNASIIAGKLYGVTGEAALTYITYTHALFFNRAIAEDEKVEDLYQVVLDGKWTIEKQIGISKNIWKDNNGDGKKDEGDGFGFMSLSATCIDCYGSSFELPILQRNAAGDLKFAVNLDKTASMLKTMNQYFWQTPGVYIVPNNLAGDAAASEIAMVEMFANGQSLFLESMLTMCSTPAMRNMEDPYGIIPTPKYDEAQQEYHSYVHDTISMYFVSSAVTESRLAMVGATLECLFSESQDCRYKLFEEALKVKYQSTEKTGRMLDIMIDSVVVDPAMVFCIVTGEMGLYLRGLVSKKTNSVAGYWRMNQSGFEKKMQTFEDQIKNLK